MFPITSVILCGINIALIQVLGQFPHTWLSQRALGVGIVMRRSASPAIKIPGDVIIGVRLYMAGKNSGGIVTRVLIARTVNQHPSRVSIV